MLGENDKWPEEINTLTYTDRGLYRNEINYIKKTLTVGALRSLVNIRYAVDPCRYDKMTKKELADELKYNRYD